MSETMPYADIIILALIAGFILLRLRSVLGQKTGNEDPNFFKKFQPSEEREEPIVRLDEKSLKPKPEEEPDLYLAAVEGTEVAAGLRAIRARDPQFSATDFLKGARIAFEMVFDAFAKGDKDTLRRLMADEPYQDFAAEIDRRAREKTRSETTLVSVEAKDIAQAALAGSTARLTVNFASEQIIVTRGADDKIVEGDPSEIHPVEDQWVFERDVTSKNPNWKIIET